MKNERRASRPPRGRRPLLPGRIGPTLIAAALASCASSNYDFGVHSDVGLHSRASDLAEDLALERQVGSEEELYDVSVVPLAHSHLSVFAEVTDPDEPPGYVEADIDAYLPLFGIVDATVSRYSPDHRVYEHHEYDSYFWGLFQTHRELIDTQVGLREKRSKRLLWLLSWHSEPEYTPTEL